MAPDVFIILYLKELYVILLKSKRKKEKAPFN